MEAQTFLDNFGTIAQAPDGIDQLRQLILNLAIQGTLVEQDLGEEPVETALCGLREMKSEFLKEKVQGRAKIPRVVEDSERTSEVPDGWSWARIDDTGKYVNGLAFKAADWRDSGIPIIRIQNLSDPSKEFNYTQGDHRADRMVVTGDLLVSWSATLDAFVWDRGDGVVNQHIFKVVPEERVVAKGFLFFLLKHTIQVLAASDAAHGLAMKHINRGPFVSHPVLIPPLAEQHRIVAKVDELMALCDQLETQQQTRTQTVIKLRASALDALATAESADELQTALERIHINWEALASEVKGVGLLRETILRLSVKGRLLPQSLSDPHAAAAIELARRQLAAGPGPRGRSASTTKIGGTAALSVGMPEKRSPPQGWAVTALTDIARLETGHTPDRNVDTYWDGPFSWIGIPDARACHGGYITSTGKSVTQSGIDNSATRLLPAGTVCLSRTASVGYTVVMGNEMCTSQDFVNFVCTDAVLPRYLQTIFMAEGADILRFAKGAVHQTIYFPEVKAFHILLPPVAEQRRIVAKVDEFMVLCDELEARLVERDRIGEALAASVVEVFAA